MFDIGVLLIVAGLLAGRFGRPFITRTIAGYQWFAGSEDFDLRAPSGLVVTGLILTIVGATKVNSR